MESHHCFDCPGRDPDGDPEHVEQHLWYSDTFPVPTFKKLVRDWCCVCGIDRDI